MKTINSLKTPTFLQRLQWVLDPVKYLEKAAREYPDLFTAEVIGFGDSMIFVNHPQAIQKILTNDRKQFTAPGDLNKILTPLVGNYSIFMLNSDRHKRERQLLMPSFHGDRMRTYGQLITEIADNAINQLQPNQTFNARVMMQKITLRVILEVVFGLRKGERYQQIEKLTQDLLNRFNSPILASFLFFSNLQKDWGKWSPWGYFLHLQRQLDELLYAEISERRQNPDASRTDILSLMMSARDEAGEAMSDQELRDELLTLLLAGHDTTALGLAWALYWIHHQPEIKEKLLQEIDSLGEFPEHTSIFRLPYLTAVCNESLRIHSVAMLTFPRVVQEPVEMLGNSFKKGTVVVGCIYLLHHREDLYPESHKFKPERFLERQYSPYEFMPFGGGVRRCIGEALAQFEMKLTLATILSQYELELADQRPIKPQRRGVVLAPSGGVKMVFKGKRIVKNTSNSVLTLV